MAGSIGRETVAERLRRKREELGLERVDIAAATRIRRVHIQALEEGRYDRLPGHAYVVGFLRTYSTFLGLDEAEIIQRYKEELAGDIRQPTYKLPHPVPERGVPTGAIMLIAALLAAGGYGGWYYLSATDRQIADLIEPLPDRLKSLLGYSREAPVVPGPIPPAPIVPGLSLPPTPPPPSSVAEIRLPSAISPAPSAISSANSATTSGQRTPAGSTATGSTATVSVPVTPGAAPGAAQSTGAGSGEAGPASRSTQPSAPSGATATPAVPATGPSLVVPPLGGPSVGSVAGAGNDPSVVRFSSASAGGAILVQPSAGPPSAGSGALATTGSSTASSAATVPAAIGGAAPSGAVGAESGGAGPSLSVPAARPTNTAAVVVPALPPEPPPPTTPAAASNEVQPTGNGRVWGEGNANPRVVIRATERSWIRVTDGNQQIYQQTLNPGDIYRVPNRSGLEMRSGNAGGIVVFVDGRELDALGASGRVVTVPLDPPQLIQRFGGSTRTN